eukprot:TRINITY_DN95364_c0_g1_i1.p1 TRINITY_DN95364_c0_g1~~TRINITY_DN95364_c0_g1_i1.p1  ORF type:complete len:173 (-),score=28.33 TRINITY_DN95364_c0_g1_i1:242-697(-)
MAPVSAPRSSSPAPVAAKLPEVCDENAVKNVQSAAKDKEKDVKVETEKLPTKKDDKQKPFHACAWAAKVNVSCLVLAIAFTLLCVVTAVYFYFSSTYSEVVKKRCDEVSIACREALTAICTAVTGFFHDRFSQASTASERTSETAVTSSEL